MGRGGARAGAGRKPKTALERAITGDPGHRGGRLLNHPNAGQVPMVAPVDEFDAPDELKPDERNVWLQLAPFAFANRTLIRATSLMFVRLCKNIVLERQYADSVMDRGGANHRGLIQRVDAELLRFNLSPNGKAIYEEQTEQPANKLDRWMKKVRA